MEFCVKLLSFPSWERGLKSAIERYCGSSYPVVPLVGAWIEIVWQGIYFHFHSDVVPLVGAWIEIEKA